MNIEPAIGRHGDLWRGGHPASNIEWEISNLIGGTN
jgi:hypothetical protein